MLCGLYIGPVVVGLYIGPVVVGLYIGPDVVGRKSRSLQTTVRVPSIRRQRSRIQIRHLMQYIKSRHDKVPVYYGKHFSVKCTVPLC